MNAARWIGAARALLLAFVFLTIGYAAGRNAARTGRGTPPEDGFVPVSAADAGEEVVEVIYLHATLRCRTCNTMERLSRDVIEEDFAPEQASGRVAWRTVNYQERTDLAERYGVMSSCVVLARLRDGSEKGFRRMDDVWTLVGTPEAFKIYIRAGIRAELDAADAGRGS